MLSSFDWYLIQKIIIAAVLGGLMGIEREMSGRAAGLRTSMIIAIGSCLFTILSAHGFMALSPDNFDPTRIASQIVVGIGFIGAGVLLKNDHHISGITTASDIWLVAALGMAAGMGLTKLAIFTTIFALFILICLRPVGRALDDFGKKLQLRRHPQKQGNEKASALKRTF